MENELQKMKDKMATDLYGETAKDAQDKGLCIQCKEPAIPKCYSDAGRREFYISGMCEVCFDELCKGV